MEHLAVSASIRIRITQNSYLWSRTRFSLAGSCASTGISFIRMAPAIARRGCFSTTYSSKAMAMQGGKGEPRFPPQHQDKQPGKEYLMNPLPQFANPDYKPSGKLYGKVALVTGGDSGIGRSVCYHFSKEGATIAFTYVKGDEDIDADDTLKIINDSKVKGSSDPIAIPTDLRHAVKHMKEGCSIINTTSVIAYKGSGKWLDYGSTKGAILSFTRGLSSYLMDKGIRVNAVAPGPVWTPLEAAALNDEELATFGSSVPMDRAGQPYEIAPSYVFLASDDSSYFTGQVLHPNGGEIING